MSKSCNLLSKSKNHAKVREMVDPSIHKLVNVLGIFANEKAAKSFFYIALQETEDFSLEQYQFSEHFSRAHKKLSLPVLGGSKWRISMKKYQEQQHHFDTLSHIRQRLGGVMLLPVNTSQTIDYQIFGKGVDFIAVPDRETMGTSAQCEEVNASVWNEVSEMVKHSHEHDYECNERCETHNNDQSTMNNDTKFGDFLNTLDEKIQAELASSHENRYGNDTYIDDEDENEDEDEEEDNDGNDNEKENEEEKRLLDGVALNFVDFFGNSMNDEEHMEYNAFAEKCKRVETGLVVEFPALLENRDIQYIINQTVQPVNPQLVLLLSHDRGHRNSMLNCAKTTAEMLNDPANTLVKTSTNNLGVVQKSFHVPTCQIGAYNSSAMYSTQLQLHTLHSVGKNGIILAIHFAKMSLKDRFIAHLKKTFLFKRGTYQSTQNTIMMTMMMSKSNNTPLQSPGGIVTTTTPLNNHKKNESIFKFPKQTQHHHTQGLPSRVLMYDFEMIGILSDMLENGPGINVMQQWALDCENDHLPQSVRRAILLTLPSQGDGLFNIILKNGWKRFLEMYFDALDHLFVGDMYQLYRHNMAMLVSNVGGEEENALNVDLMTNTTILDSNSHIGKRERFFEPNFSKAAKFSMNERVAEHIRRMNALSRKKWCSRENVFGQRLHASHLGKTTLNDVSDNNNNDDENGEADDDDEDNHDDGAENNIEYYNGEFADEWFPNGGGDSNNNNCYNFCNDDSNSSWQSNVGSLTAMSTASTATSIFNENAKKKKMIENCNGWVFQKAMHSFINRLATIDSILIPIVDNQNGIIIKWQPKPWGEPPSNVENNDNIDINNEDNTNGVGDDDIFNSPRTKTTNSTPKNSQPTLSSCGLSAAIYSICHKAVIYFTILKPKNLDIRKPDYDRDADRQKSKGFFTSFNHTTNVSKASFLHPSFCFFPKPKTTETPHALCSMAACTEVFTKLGMSSPTAATTATTTTASDGAICENPPLGNIHKEIPLCAYEYYLMVRACLLGDAEQSHCKDWFCNDIIDKSEQWEIWMMIMETTREFLRNPLRNGNVVDNNNNNISDEKFMQDVLLQSARQTYDVFSPIASIISNFCVNGQYYSAGARVHGRAGHRATKITNTFAGVLNRNSVSTLLSKFSEEDLHMSADHLARFLLTQLYDMHERRFAVARDKIFQETSNEHESLPANAPIDLETLQGKRAMLLRPNYHNVLFLVPNLRTLEEETAVLVFDRTLYEAVILDASMKFSINVALEQGLLWPQSVENHDEFFQHDMNASNGHFSRGKIRWIQMLNQRYTILQGDRYIYLVADRRILDCIGNFVVPFMMLKESVGIPQHMGEIIPQTRPQVWTSILKQLLMGSLEEVHSACSLLTSLIFSKSRKPHANGWLFGFYYSEREFKQDEPESGETLGTSTIGDDDNDNDYDNNNGEHLNNTSFVQPMKKRKMSNGKINGCVSKKPRTNVNAMYCRCCSRKIDKMEIVQCYGNLLGLDNFRKIRKIYDDRNQTGASEGSSTFSQQQQYRKPGVNLNWNDEKKFQRMYNYYFLDNDIDKNTNIHNNDDDDDDNDFLDEANNQCKKTSPQSRTLQRIACYLKTHPNAQWIDVAVAMNDDPHVNGHFTSSDSPDDLIYEMMTLQKIGQTKKVLLDENQTCRYCRLGVEAKLRVKAGALATMRYLPFLLDRWNSKGDLCEEIVGPHKKANEVKEVEETPCSNPKRKLGGSKLRNKSPSMQSAESTLSSLSGFYDGLYAFLTPFSLRHVNYLVLQSFKAMIEISGNLAQILRSLVPEGMKILDQLCIRTPELVTRNLYHQKIKKMANSPEYFWHCQQCREQLERATSSGDDGTGDFQCCSTCDDFMRHVVMFPDCLDAIIGLPIGYSAEAFMEGEAATTTATEENARVCNREYHQVPLHMCIYPLLCSQMIPAKFSQMFFNAIQTHRSRPKLNERRKTGFHYPTFFQQTHYADRNSTTAKNTSTQDFLVELLKHGSMDEHVNNLANIADKSFHSMLWERKTKNSLRTTGDVGTGSASALVNTYHESQLWWRRLLVNPNGYSFCNESEYNYLATTMASMSPRSGMYTFVPTTQAIDSGHWLYLSEHASHFHENPSGVLEKTAYFLFACEKVYATKDNGDVVSVSESSGNPHDAVERLDILETAKLALGLCNATENCYEENTNSSGVETTPPQNLSKCRTTWNEISETIMESFQERARNMYNNEQSNFELTRKLFACTPWPMTSMGETFAREENLGGTPLAYYFNTKRQDINTSNTDDDGNVATLVTSMTNFNVFPYFPDALLIRTQGPASTTKKDAYLSKRDLVENGPLHNCDPFILNACVLHPIMFTV